MLYVAWNLCKVSQNITIQKPTFLQLEFWREPSEIEKLVDIRVPAGALDNLVRHLQDNQVQHKVTVHDLQR